MDFNLTEEQKILKETARNFLESECPSSFVRKMEEDQEGFRKELWQKMADLGWMALVIPEEYDGVGGSFLDLIVMMEEMGRACTPGPFFSTVVLGAGAILEAGSEEQKKQFLPGIAAGNLRLCVAHSEPGFTRYDPLSIEVSATLQGDDYVINGTKLFVSDAHVSDYIICITRTSGEKKSKSGITMFVVDSKSRGVEVIPLTTFAGDKQFEVVFEKVRVPVKDILGALNGGAYHLERLLQKATICKCAEMLGGAQKVLDMASTYAKEREQFGKLIGSFQAVQHHCANMLIAIEGSRYILYKVAWMLSEGVPCSKEVSMVKAWVSDAYKQVVALGHQVQGGTAYMIEHDMPLYSRRAKIAEITFGDSNFHRRVVAQELGL